MFWNRSKDPDGGTVLGYEIRQHGAVIATVDALSYFTYALIDGEHSTFPIAAIELVGEHSTEQSNSVTGVTTAYESSWSAMASGRRFNILSTTYSSRVLTRTGSALAALTDITIEVNLPEDQDIYKPSASRLVFMAIVDVLAAGVARYSKFFLAHRFPGGPNHRAE